MSPREQFLLMVQVVMWMIGAIACVTCAQRMEQGVCEEKSDSLKSGITILAMFLGVQVVLVVKAKYPPLLAGATAFSLGAIGATAVLSRPALIVGKTSATCVQYWNK